MSDDTIEKFKIPLGYGVTSRPDHPAKRYRRSNATHRSRFERAAPHPPALPAGRDQER